MDISKAPTKTHGELASLLPKSALKKDSVQYGNWRPETSDVDVTDAANATLPVVVADYRSTGYTITTDPETEGGSAEQEYIQKCRLYLVEAPDEMATQPIADQFIANLKAKGFSERTELAFADGTKEAKPILRYARIDSQEKVDDVYVAYIKITGKLVLFAIESEAADRSSVPGAGQLTRIDNAGIGTRVGGQLIVLVLDRLTR